jgi:hypothetical protein
MERLRPLVAARLPDGEEEGGIVLPGARSQGSTHCAVTGRRSAKPSLNHNRHSGLTRHRARVRATRWRAPE